MDDLILMINDLFTDADNKKVEIKSATFNKEKGVTAVVLKDGRKGIARAVEGDDYDEKVGFALAYCYAVFGSKTQFNKKVGSLKK